MNFDLIAKDLLRPAPETNLGNPLERANTLAVLADSGFGIKEIFSELRQLYDGAEDDILKKQLLDIVIKVHGLYKEEERKSVPSFVFNISGSKQRVQDMLCPPQPQAPTTETVVQ